MFATLFMGPLMSVHGPDRSGHLLRVAPVAFGVRHWGYERLYLCAWYPEEAIREELDRGTVKALPMRPKARNATLRSVPPSPTAQHRQPGPATSSPHQSEGSG